MHVTIDHYATDLLRVCLTTKARRTPPPIMTPREEVSTLDASRHGNQPAVIARWPRRQLIPRNESLPCDKSESI